MYVDRADADYAKAIEPYEALSSWTAPLKRMERTLVGRDREIRSLMASFMRPELSNVILLGPAGSGKTAIVQGAMERDESRIYLEVDMAAMVDGLSNESEMGSRLARLFDETSAFQKDYDREVVLFIDEIHKIVQKSPAAVEDLKPMLADSGTRGIRVVAATTYDEFREYIAPNQALVERLQRMNVPEADHDMTLAILRGMVERYHVRRDVTDTVLENIYTYTQRYIPANAQPRKSILVLDSMVGWHRSENLPMDRHLLADVIYEQEGVKVDLDVDPLSIRETLDEHVYAQRYATLSVAKRLQLCLAGLNDPHKPQATLLFSGSTGTGKTEMAKTLARTLFGDAQDSFIRFDMTEFSQPESVDRFRVSLTDAVWAHPFSVILLDEIEKACGEVTRLLLPVLDDGRLIDAHGREVTFINAYIIMTTNAASEIYRDIAQYEASDTGEGAILDRYMKLIRRSLAETNSGNRFPPELLGRIDTIVPFQPLSEHTLRRIVLMSLARLRQRLRKDHGIDFDCHARVSDYIVKNRTTTDSDAGGARSALQVLETDVTSEVAAFINEHPSADEVFVWVHGEMASENKLEVKSRATIRVGTRQDFDLDEDADPADPQHRVQARLAKARISSR